MTKKQKRILKNKIENIFIKVLATLIFFSPILLYVLGCYLTSFIK